MKNIHLIPTDKPSRLAIEDKELILVNNIGNYRNAQHIYITSDEEIKEEDYVFWERRVYKYKDFMEMKTSVYTDFFSIILTTDQDLINDGVQAIDDEFLEWFVKNPSCEKVKVQKIQDKLYIPIEQLTQYKSQPKEMQFEHSSNIKECYYYRIIIPKEELKQEWTPTQGEEVWIKVFSNWSKGTYIGYDTTKNVHIVREDKEGGGNLLSSGEILAYYSMPNEPKQETLEEAAEKFRSENPGTMQGGNNTKILKAFKAGAKWQQEKMYSEEDLIELLNFVSKEYNISNGIGWFHTHDSIEDVSSKEVLEQFKKK